MQDHGEFQVIESGLVTSSSNEKPKPQKAVAIAPTNPDVIPMVQVAQVVGDDFEYSDDSGTEDSWSESGGSYTDDDTDSIVSVASLGSVIPYPYSLENMYASAPLKAPVSIDGQVIEAVIDSGASVSVMSESLFKRLKLQGNGDSMSLATFYDRPTKKSFVCPYVNVMVAGHLRPEHFCVQPDVIPGLGTEYLILGMTWTRAYDVTVSHKSGIISFAVNNGKGVAELQGRAFRVVNNGLTNRVNQVPLTSIEEDAEVLAISVCLGEGGALKKEVMALSGSKAWRVDGNVMVDGLINTVSTVSGVAVDIERLLDVQDFKTAVKMCQRAGLVNKEASV